MFFILLTVLLYALTIGAVVHMIKYKVDHIRSLAATFVIVNLVYSVILVLLIMDFLEAI